MTNLSDFQSGDRAKVRLRSSYYEDVTVEGPVRRDAADNVWIGPTLLASGRPMNHEWEVEVLEHEREWRRAQVIRATVPDRGRIVLMRDPRDGSWFTGPGEDDDRAYIFDNDLLSDVSVIVDAAGRVHDDA